MMMMMMGYKKNNNNNNSTAFVQCLQVPSRDTAVHPSSSAAVRAAPGRPWVRMRARRGASVAEKTEHRPDVTTEVSQNADD